MFVYGQFKHVRLISFYLCQLSQTLLVHSIHDSNIPHQRHSHHRKPTLSSVYCLYIHVVVDKINHGFRMVRHSWHLLERDNAQYIHISAFSTDKFI